MLTVDKKLIEQVIINLITNAFQAVSNQSVKEIRIKAFPGSEENVFIQVIDNGPGIPDSEMENIFIPFYTTKEKGSGIGLSLSRQIMRLHNGKISVKSDPGHQTTATLEF